MRYVLSFMAATIVALIAAGGGHPAPAFGQDTGEDLLGSIALTVGNNDPRFGFSEGAFGAVQGQFPGQLFEDGAGRPVSALFETALGDWTLLHGGAAATWSPEDVVIVATWTDGVDSRRFHLDGHVVESTGPTLKVRPPLPGFREWRVREGETVNGRFLPQNPGRKPGPASGPCRSRCAAGIVC